MIVAASVGVIQVLLMYVVSSLYAIYELM